MVLQLYYSVQFVYIAPIHNSFNLRALYRENTVRLVRKTSRSSPVIDLEDALLLEELAVTTFTDILSLTL